MSWSRCASDSKSKAGMEGSVSRIFRQISAMVSLTQLPLGLPGRRTKEEMFGHRESIGETCRNSKLGGNQNVALISGCAPLGDARNATNRCFFFFLTVLTTVAVVLLLVSGPLRKLH